MARAGGVLLMVLASASIALGSPLCCLMGIGCGGAGAAEAREAKHDCCPHCTKEQPTKPAPKPCEKKDCTCRHDVAPHVNAAAHAPLVAVFDLPPAPLPARPAAEAPAPSHRALPSSPASRSHPLLL